jgi:N-acyl-D-amino-acid deacylase
MDKAKGKMFDIAIKNGWIVDGTGQSRFKGTLYVRDGKVERIDKGSPHLDQRLNAAKVIDVAEKIVCPGFIDIHSHNDLSLLNEPFSPDKIWQGVTTQTIGHCGFSAAPASSAWWPFLAGTLTKNQALKERWTTLEQYLSLLEGRPLGTNVAAFVGYGAIRSAVMGSSERPASSTDVRKMTKLLAQCMDDGAFGFTTGLAYPPQCSATTEELAELARVVADHDGLYATHVRHITYDIKSGVEEAITIAKRSGVRLQVAHLQIRPNPNHQLTDIVEMINSAKKEGIRITCDQYPYSGALGPLTPLFPASVLKGSAAEIRKRLTDADVRLLIRDYMHNVVENYFQWENIVLVKVKEFALQSKSILTIANFREEDPRDIAIDILANHGLDVTALYFGKREEDLRVAALLPYCMVGSDGMLSAENNDCHPRTFGTFPRVIRKYVREEEAMSLEQAIHKMTGLTAQTLRLQDRGVLREGKKADIVVIDPNTLYDTASYLEPAQPAAGIDYVIVNGQITYEMQQEIPAGAGLVLRHVNAN